MTEPNIDPNWVGYHDDATLTRATDHGIYRARLVHDPDAGQPYDDGGCPVLRIDPNHYGGGSVESARYALDSEAHDGIDAGAAETLERWINHFGTRKGLEVFERWLRIFHGGTIAEYNVGHYRKYAYVAYTTQAMREYWGVADDVRVEADLDEWIAWVEGEVFGYVIERATSFDDDGEPDGWAELDNLWGHYGEDWAKQDAQDALGWAVKDEASKRLPLDGVA